MNENPAREPASQLEIMGMQLNGKMVCPWRHETEVTLTVRFETGGSMRWRTINPARCLECGSDFRLG